MLQNYFRETSCFKKLPGLLEISNSDMWLLTDDQIHTLTLSLQLISLLISGNNPSAHNNQGLLAKYNIINLLLPIALGGMNSVGIRAQVFNKIDLLVTLQGLITLGDMLYAHKENC